MAHTPDITETLRSNASWLAFVLKGIRSGHIPDQSVIDTNVDAPEADAQALSDIIERELAKARAALAKARAAKADG